MEDLSDSISFVCYWDSLRLFRKIYEKVYLPFLIGIVYHFSGRCIIKYNFCFLLGLCTIFLADLSSSITFYSYWDCVQFLWKIYQKLNLPFLIGILYQFLEDGSQIIPLISYWDCVPYAWKIYQKLVFDILYHFFGWSIRKNICHSSLRLFSISMEDLTENKSSVSDWDFPPVLWKIYRKG